MRNYLTFLFLFLFAPAILHAQPVLEWQLNAESSGGVVASPLPLNVYSPPNYTNADYPGMEVFLPSATVPNSRFYLLKSNGSHVFSSGYLAFDGLLRSSVTAAYFQASPNAMLIFGSSNGVEFMQASGTSQYSSAGSVTSTPVLVQLDTDTWFEVVALSDNGMLYAWNLDSTYPSLISGFPVSLGGTAQMMTPAVGPLDNNSYPEIVATTSNGVHVIDRFGDYLNGWPMTFNSPIKTSPTIGKIDSFDQVTRNVVFAVSDGWLYVTRYNGGLIPGWPKNLNAEPDTSPILVDITGNGKPEIIVCTSDSKVHAIQANGSYAPGWPVDLSDHTGSLVRMMDTERSNALFADPIVADIDGDGGLEILISIVENGRLIALNTGGSIESGWPFDIGVDTSGDDTFYSYLFGSPAIADIDDDGVLELVAGTFGAPSGPGGGGSPARIKCYELGPASCSSTLMPWPMYRQSPRRNGSIPTSQGSAYKPRCSFPLEMGFNPGTELIVDFRDHAVDLDSPSTCWTAEILGLDNLIVTQLDSTVFQISSNGWEGQETASFRLTDPSGYSCSQAVNVICGQVTDPPVCGFPARFVFEPDEQLIINYTDFVTDNDTPYWEWTCSLNGLQNLTASLIGNTTFAVESDGWVGVETATCQVADPQGSMCSNSVKIYCGYKGDANQDGAVTLADVGAMADIVLGVTAPNLYKAWAADMDDNLSITVVDLIALIDQLAQE